RFFAMREKRLLKEAINDLRRNTADIVPFPGELDERDGLETRRREIITNDARVVEIIADTDETFDSERAHGARLRHAGGKDRDTIVVFPLRDELTFALVAEDHERWRTCRMNDVDFVGIFGKSLYLRPIRVHHR